jgi:RNA polymerase sigma-70 factor (ECF subfamily)
MRSDNDLVNAAVAGDRGAFAMLIERYERPVRSVSLAILRDVELARDVAQDSFMIAFEKMSMLGNRSAFGSWILKIARRRAYRVVRAKAREQTLAEIHEPTSEPGNGKLDDQLETLLQAVVRLPQQEQVVVMLRYFDNQPVDAVAKITGRSVGTVTKQLTRARSRLKTWIGEQST